MTTRREDIQNTIGDRFDPMNANGSLWFDKFIFDSRKNEKSEASRYDQSKKDETAKAELVNQLTKTIKEPAIYGDYFYKVWQPNLQKFGAKCKRAKVKNRLAINLGSESVLETSIALHRLFGVPFIPGSALKGLVSHFLNQYGDGDWKKTGKNHKVILGDQDSAGFITFYDALYVPESGYNGKALYTDVMTPHHQDYYSEKKENNQMLPPTDWDSPNPVPFISATGEYLIAISGPDGWVELTFDILGKALETEGVGAKTSSGYGRMFYSSGFILSEAQIGEKQAERLDELLSKMDNLVNADSETRKTINKELKTLTKKVSDPQKKKDVAGKLFEKSEQLGITQRLIETKTEWFAWVMREK
jgi:CRISPR-associated protein Cmr6